MKVTQFPMHFLRTSDVRRLVDAWEHRANEAGEVDATAPVSKVVNQLASELRAADVDDGDTAETPTLAATSWRERLWTAPPETRLGVRELAAALGRPRSWVYRAVSQWTYLKRPNSAHAKVRRHDPLPARRMNGVLVFTVSDVRAWLQRIECPA